MLVASSVTREDNAENVSSRLLRAGIFFVFALVLGACGAPAPSNAECSGGPLYRDCLISEGSYIGFTIGMSSEDAFEVACQLEEQGHFLSHPILLNGDEQRDFFNTSMCELRSEAMVVSEWSFIEPTGFREQYVSLEFVRGRLQSIQLELRGWDP